MKIFKEIAGTVLLLLISTCVRLQTRDHNHEALQVLTENVLIKVLKLCRNAKIVFFGKKPNQYAANAFLQRLEKEGLVDRFPEEF